MIAAVSMLMLGALDAGIPERETVVTGARSERRLKDSVVATEVLTRDDIDASGAATLGDLLEEHPNLDVTRGLAGQTVRLQGLDMKYLLVLVDGERVTGRIDGDLDLSRFLAEDIERVEIVRGPGSALYGADAIAGVVNIITRRGRRPLAGDARVSAGSFGLLDVGVNGSTRDGPVRAKVTAGYHRGDGWDRDPSDVATTGPRFEQANVSGKLEYQAAERLSFEGRAEYFYRDTARVDLGAGNAIFDRSNRTETLTLGFTPKFSLLDDTIFRLGAHYTLFRDQFLNDQRNAAALDQYQETWDHLAQLSVIAERRFFDAHVVTAGLEGFAEALVSDRLSTNHGERFRFGVFAQDEWSIADAPKWVVVPGVRLDVDSQFGAAVSPRLTTRFDPVESLTLRASAGLGFRAPSFRELLLSFQNPGVGYIVEGSLSLKPERSASANVSGEWRPLPMVTVNANLFHNELSQLIQPISAGLTDNGALTRYVYTNIDSGFTQGLESSVRFAPFEFLSADVSYTLLNARNRANDLFLEGRSAHRATGELRVSIKPIGVKATVRAALTGPRPLYLTADENGAPVATWTKPVTTLDANVTWTPVSFLSFGLLAENLLDAGDATLLAMQPRSFMLTVSSRY